MHQGYIKFKEHKHLWELVKLILPRSNYFISGGSIRDIETNSNINDIDIYFRTEQDFNKVNDYLESHSNKPGLLFQSITNKVKVNGLTKLITEAGLIATHPFDFNSSSTSNESDEITVYKISETGNAVTYSINFYRLTLVLQLIRRDFGDYEDIYRTFDLNVCKRSLDDYGVQEHHSYSNNIEFADTHGKMYSELNACLLNRIIKYTKKGYNLNINTLIKAIRLILEHREIPSYYSGAHEITTSTDIIRSFISKIRSETILTPDELRLVINECSNIIEVDSTCGCFIGEKLYWYILDTYGSPDKVPYSEYSDYVFLMYNIYLKHINDTRIKSRMSLNTEVTNKILNNYPEYFI